ncbi:hypothetical protein [Ascidiaceihabitans sp.]|uniref:hypothetical protein n=1 Tax=Ascidiaceihabitans sp. TaxID=1872644 RepID=UPI0032996DD3
MGENKTNPIAWVDVTTQDAATGELAAAYDAVKGPDGRVENLYLAMSQTPKAIVPADAHYLALLHNPDNPLKPALAEFISTYVAILCGSAYAVANHGENFCHYMNDRPLADKMLASLHDETWPVTLQDPGFLAAVRYAQKLSLTPQDMNAEDVEILRDAGFCDKGISYIIQLVASFAYWARMINGLGTQLGADVGLAQTPHPSQ